MKRHKAVVRWIVYVMEIWPSLSALVISLALSRKSYWDVMKIREQRAIVRLRRKAKSYFVSLRWESVKMYSVGL